MQLLTLMVGLALLSVVGAMMPPLSPASAQQLLGKWYIKRWAGDMPIPEWRWKDPLPPFTFERNSLQELEFRMNLTKPTGCIQFKLPLYDGEDPGTFLTWWKHVIYIHFLPGKKFAIAYFRGRMNYQYCQMMMLMGLDDDLFWVLLWTKEIEDKSSSPLTLPSDYGKGCRTLKTDLDALRVFKLFVRSKMGETAKTKKPPRLKPVSCPEIPNAEGLRQRLRRRRSGDPSCSLYLGQNT